MVELRDKSSLKKPSALSGEFANDSDLAFLDEPVPRGHKRGIKGVNFGTKTMPGNVNNKNETNGALVSTGTNSMDMNVNTGAREKEFESNNVPRWLNTAVGAEAVLPAATGGAAAAASAGPVSQSFDQGITKMVSKIRNSGATNEANIIADDMSHELSNVNDCMDCLGLALKELWDENKKSQIEYMKTFMAILSVLSVPQIGKIKKTNDLSDNSTLKTCVDYADGSNEAETLRFKDAVVTEDVRDRAKGSGNPNVPAIAQQHRSHETGERVEERWEEARRRTAGRG